MVDEYQCHQWFCTVAIVCYTNIYMQLHCYTLSRIQETWLSNTASTEKYKELVTNKYMYVVNKSQKIYKSLNQVITSLTN